MHINGYLNNYTRLTARFGMPLTEVIRPQSFAEYIGQEHLLNGENGEISNYVRLGYLPSMVLSGPPGVGKTSLARLLADEANYVFVELSATSSSVADIKELLEAINTENTSRSRRNLLRLRVLVFIDEIHRFSTVQQDFLLPFIEAGAFVFVGATTVDPEKSVRRAILSRCHLFKLQALGEKHLHKVALRATLYENMRRKVCHKLCFLRYTDLAVDAVVKYAHGDMRSAVNLIEILGARLSSPEYKLSDSLGETEVDETTVIAFIKTLSKARFGLQSESNLPLLAHLLRSLRYPQSVSCNEEILNTPATKEEEAPDSDLESWVDEKETLGFMGHDRKLQAWAEHIPYSDDNTDILPGPIYSDETEIPALQVKDISKHSASKFRIISATHACLQLLNKGESPLSILKYLVLFTCTHSLPEQNELVNVLSVLKAVQKSGIDGEHLLFNCIERLAGTHAYEKTLLREYLEAAKSHNPKNTQNEPSNAEKLSIDCEVVYDNDLAERLLQEIPLEKGPERLGMPITSADQLGPEYTLGEGLDLQDGKKLYTQVMEGFV